MALKPNPLNKFSSFNCVWSLDVATKEEFNTGNIRNKRGRIARTGGIRNTASSLATQFEVNLGIKGEYFINNVSVDSIVSPNPHSGVTRATIIRFEITEPYSIGLFLETLQLAAAEAGYDNYLSAPFVLTCDFIGYDSNGNLSTLEDGRRVLAIKFSNISFSVTAAGSVYQVQAYNAGDQALGDQVQQIKTQISLRGDTIGNMLSNFGNVAPRDPRSRGDTGEGTNRSLVAVLNEHEESIRSSASAELANKYEILFVEHPSNPNSISNIDTKKMITDIQDLTIQDIELDKDHYDEATSTYTRGNLTINFKDSIFQFKAGTKIEKIIEEIILSSEWSKELIDQQPDAEGYVNWFRIFSQVTYLNGKDADGNEAMKYTYMVYPYKVHASTLGNLFKNINYNSSVSNAVKGYSYIYTGENTDIINFDIDIKYAWIQQVANLTNQNQSERADPGGSIYTIPNADGNVKTINTTSQVGQATDEPRKEVQRDPDLPTAYGGSPIDVARIKIARNMNNSILNSNADLVVVKLTIWGDPYFLPDSFASVPSGKFITQNQFIDDLSSEVDVLLKFGSGVDYKNNLLSPNIARQFSGVYRVYKLTSFFENNLFRQELELVRRPIQDTNTINNVCSVIDSLNSNTSAPLLPPSSGSASGSDIEFFLRQAEKTEQLFSAFSRLSVKDIASSLNISTGDLIGKLTGLTTAFDTAKQLASSFNNIQSLTNISSIQDINLQNIQQLTTQLVSAEDMFKQAFNNLNMETLVNTLNLNIANPVNQVVGEIQGQIKNTLGQVQGIVTQVQNIPRQLQSLPQSLSGAASDFVTLTAKGPVGINKNAVDLGSAFSPIISLNPQALVQNFKSVTNNLTTSVNNLTSSVNNIRTTVNNVEQSFKSISSNLPRF